MFYVLWSNSSSRFEVESEQTMFSNNMRTYYMGTKTDYVPVAKFDTREECAVFIADIRELSGAAA